VFALLIVCSRAHLLWDVMSTNPDNTNQGPANQTNQVASSNESQAELLERQTVEQSRQSKKLDDLHAEIHHKETTKRSQRIENAGIKKHVKVLEEASSSFEFLGDVLAGHASGASVLTPDQAANLATKCDQGKLLCEDRIQYHEECDRLGFDVAKELLALRERGKHDPVELALEEKAIKTVNKRQSAKPEKSEKPAKKANTGGNPLQPAFPPFWYPPTPGFQPAPLPSFTPPLAPLPQPRPFRQSRPTLPCYPAPSPFTGYGPTFPGYPNPSAPSPSFGMPPRGASFSGACYNCHQFGHRSSECPNTLASASNAGRYIS
jgi:hypothetical protein